jgi:kynureninase
MPALRRKSEQLIEFFDRRLAETLGGRVENITPTTLAERGCQFALRVTNGDGRRVFDELQEARVLCDWREPDVIRVAPVPLYNSFDDIDRFVDILDGIVR